MKKNVIIVIVLGILTGFLFGNLIYKNYSGIEYLNEDGNIYYVQYGVYTSQDAALSNASNLDNYLIQDDGNGYLATIAFIVIQETIGYELNESKDDLTSDIA